MKFILTTLSLLVLIFSTSNAQTIHVLYTTDIHGSIFPYDFIKNVETKHSLSQAYNYISSVRDTAEYTILLDNGDNLQGTPAVYYYNYIDTISPHILSQIYNYMKYDAVTVGNHDIETGHSVYDRVSKQYEMPFLAANAIRESTGDPYFKPYTIVKRGDKKIAIIGLTTPYIPHWLPEHFWKGIMFEDMIESAQKWIKKVKDTESPDIIIGLFHSGYDYTYGNQDIEKYKNENASALVAESVAGFDAILIGHDHRLYNKEYKNPNGENVIVLDAGTAARNIGHLTISFDANGNHNCAAEIVSLSKTTPSGIFNEEFSQQYDAIKNYSQQKIADIATDINANESLFGNSAVVDLVQEIMLRYTGADISVSAPLMINAKIEKGPVCIGNMFNIYKYENLLNVIELTGEEIKKYLEYSYDLWINNPKENNNHILKIDENGNLINRHYNFDSAAGIDYTINPYKKKGERITILKMSKGEPFDMTHKYKVAINSYRCNGGGGHLEFGVGIKSEDIQSRIIKTYNEDLRNIIIREWSKKGTIEPQAASNWKFVPENELQKIIENDKKLFNY